MDLAARLVEQLGPGDEAADQGGQGRGPGQVRLGHPVGHLRAEDEEPPGASLARDRDDDLAARLGQDRPVRAGQAAPAFDQDRPVLVERSSGHADRGRAAATVGQGRAFDRSRFEGRVVPAEGGHAGQPVCRADQVDGPAEGQVEVAAGRAQPAELGQDRQLEQVTLALGRAFVGAEGGQRGPAGSRAPPAPVVNKAGRRPCRRQAGQGPGRAAAPPGRDTRQASGRRRPEEALEVAQPVAPVTARVDPVVAQPALVAPGPDRIRMDAQETGGLGDRQRGVGRSLRLGAGHVHRLEELVSPGSLRKLPVLANRTNVPRRLPGLRSASAPPPAGTVGGRRHQPGGSRHGPGSGSGTAPGAQGGDGGSCPPRHR